MNRQKTKTREYCPACGAALEREKTDSCRVCGKFLQEGYFPLDNLRASYKKQTWQNEDNKEMTTLFEENKNTASETARAFAIYSTVPYLGILFCPGAVLLGWIGIFVARRDPEAGGGRTSALSIAGGFLVFGIQIFLWWLLYYIPTLERHF